MKKIVLNYDNSGFEFANSMFTEKNNLIKAIQDIAKNTLDLEVEVKDSLSLNENIYKAVEIKYKSQNLLNLTGEKLVDLMQIDLSPIFEASRLLSSYDGTDENKQPTKEMFTLTVDNDDELLRYNHAMKCISVINETKQLTNDRGNFNNFFFAFGRIVRTNATGVELEPLPAFVKQ